MYNIIIAKWDGKRRSVEEKYLYVGQKLVENRDPLLNKYLDQKVDKLDIIITRIRENDSKDVETLIKYNRIREGLKEIQLEMRR